MPKKCNTYEEYDLQKALQHIKNGKISKKAASKLYNVPRSTLQFRLGPKFSKTRPGPDTVLTEEEEERIVDWIKVSQKKGFPKRKEDVTSAVKYFLEQTDRSHPFGEANIPGKGWFASFLKRHPSLSLRLTDPVSSASATVAISDIHSWFDCIKTFLTEQNYMDILKDPTRILNGDETNFLLCPKTKNVLAAKGAKNVYEVDRGLAKSNLTVMFTFSAAGVIPPPMVIYPYKRVPEEIRKSLPKGWGLGVSDNGWMTKEIFYEYISKVLHPYLLQLGTIFPVIYFVDGHATHLTLAVSELCVKLKIILVALYPNATRILQPADVAAFKPLKSSWNNKVLEWRRNNPMESLTKEKFAPLLFEAIHNSISVETIQKGFRACGLYPFDKYSINSSKCLGRSSVKSTNSREQNQTTTQDDAFKMLCATVGQNKVEIFEKLDKGEFEIDSCGEDLLLLYDVFKQLRFGGKPKQIVCNKSTQTEAETQITGNSSIDINSINEFILINNPLSTQVQTELINIDTTFSPNSNVLKYTELTTQSNNVSCITLPSYTTGGIDDYLNWPETPVRKGCKLNQTKKPFVVTSPLWIQQEKLKKETKQKIESDRENRKAERIKKRDLKKLQIKDKPKRTRKANPKLQPSTNLQTTTITPIKALVSIENYVAQEIIHNVTNINEPANTSFQINSLTENFCLDKEKRISEPQNVDFGCNQSSSNLEFRDHNKSPTNSEKCFGENSSPEISDVRIYDPPTDQQHHVRNLFLVETKHDFGSNTPASGSMCYYCTFALSKNCSSENFGIKCSICTREFHLKCLIKLKYKYIPVFECNGCKKRD